MTVSDRLRNLRLEKGVSRPFVEKQTGISSETIGGIEEGRNVSQFERIALLSKYYGVSCDYIAGFTEERNPALPKWEEKDGLFHCPFCKRGQKNKSCFCPNCGGRIRL